MKAKIESIVAPINQSFVCRRFDLRVFDHPLHYHPEVELAFIVSSSGNRLIGDSIEPFEPGDLCLIGGNLPHVYRNPLVPETGAVSEVLQFRRELAQGLLDTTVEFTEFSGMLDRSARGLCFDDQTGALVGEKLQRLRKADGVKRWVLFFEVIEDLLSAPEPRPLASLGYAGASDLGYPDGMYRACQYILEHFDEDINQKQMAEMVGFSQAHFSREFKKTTRQTFRRFLLQVRLGHSARLLEETEWSIADIAFRSGFSNLSNFNRRFLQFYRMTPKAFRNFKNAR